MNKLGNLQQDFDNENAKDILENLFIDSKTPELEDTDDTLETPKLSIDLEEVDLRTQNRARTIAEKLSAYYFDPVYVENHPYIKDKIAQEVDNIRRLLKMLAVNEKAQDTLITSITVNCGKGTLYGSLTSLQNSMLSMQTQLNSLTQNLEDIFKEMQENCEKTWEDKEKEEVDEDGSMVVRGSREFIQQIEALRSGALNINDVVANTGTEN